MRSGVRCSLPRKEYGDAVCTSREYRAHTFRVRSPDAHTAQALGLTTLTQRPTITELSITMTRSMALAVALMCTFAIAPAWAQSTEDNSVFDFSLPGARSRGLAGAFVA